MHTNRHRHTDTDTDTQTQTQTQAKKGYNAARIVCWLLLIIQVKPKSPKASEVAAALDGDAKRVSDT